MESKVIGQRLINLRKDLGQTRTYAAKQLGISYSTLCSYEYGVHVPKDNMKVALASYYGISVEKLFFDPEYHET